MQNTLHQRYKEIDIFFEWDGSTRRGSFVNPATSEVLANYLGSTFQADSAKKSYFIATNMTYNEFDAAGDDELNALDFSQGLERLEINRDSMVVAYQTNGERRCLLKMEWVGPGFTPRIQNTKYTFFTKEDEERLKKKEEEKLKQEEEK